MAQKMPKYPGIMPKFKEKQLEGNNSVLSYRMPSHYIFYILTFVAFDL